MQKNNFYDEKVANQRTQNFSSISLQSLDINFVFMNILAQIIKNRNTILDIGTGNGYVLSEINKKFPDYDLSLVGIDNSQKMLDIAFQCQNIKYLCCDNNNIPLSDKTFDIITAKNVTRFNPKELSRLLKDNSFFLMREYSEGKGLVEVSRLFKERLIRSRTILFYQTILSEAGFSIQKVFPFKMKRTFADVEHIITTIKTYPFIEDFSSSDEDTIRKNFPKKTVVITSDPFILLAKKEHQRD